MLASTRRREIMHRLVTDGYVEAKAIADELGVDASTIRRDLDALEREGQAQRTHGGARPTPGATAKLPYTMKEGERLTEKAAIGQAAADRVRDGQTVILDSGSTTYEVARALHNHTGLTVITNDLRIAKYIAETPGMRLLVTGGELLGSVFTLVGERAITFLSDYTADWAFLGADAIDAEAGVTNMNTLEVPLKRAMITAAAHAVVVADSSKFGRRALAKVAGLDEITNILTDSDLTPTDSRQFGDVVIQAPPTTEG
ncbi:DeoR/GlpR family DNA-binding transcription regulator [Nocardia sp. CA2R105]|uniref:DeoR/GlpR family DNA-binding transcription regulator n=1 Tax=Nocardia coffeae TaxID=2873381 RepID=UPI001CA6F579|nr:DeoR/GlpR family DNA-binding transcription regulator [Nocardia coffeae]MBY8861446.1 DeoR/GlpR family DNA-binding transcription regulator [Nocardia coffeae]